MPFIVLVSTELALLAGKQQTDETRKSLWFHISCGGLVSMLY